MEVPDPHNFSFLYCPRLTSFISTYLSLVKKRSFQTQSFPVAYVFVSAPKKHYFVSQNEIGGKATEIRPAAQHLHRVMTPDASFLHLAAMPTTDEL